MRIVRRVVELWVDKVWRWKLMFACAMMIVVFLTIGIIQGVQGDIDSFAIEKRMQADIDRLLGEREALKDELLRLTSERYIGQGTVEQPKRATSGF